MEVSALNVRAMSPAPTTSTTASEMVGMHTVQVRLNLPGGGTLGTQVTALVSDAGTGTATSILDYDVVGAQMVTFPVGSADGALQPITVENMGTPRIARPIKPSSTKLPYRWL